MPTTDLIPALRTRLRRHGSTALMTLSSAALLFTMLPVLQGQKAHQMGDMPGMDMGNKDEMRDMGPSMAAMAGHMLMTPTRPIQPGDEEKARAVVAAAKAVMDRYRDYRKALADGYVIARPDVEQVQYHFTNAANGELADVRFDPSKPSALLYLRTPHQMYKLEGVMYTARVHELDEELDRRIPLSIARWHQHVNFCEAPPDRPNEYMGPHPVFGMFGEIKTKEACDAARGKFYPFLFNWMVHVFPYEKNLKDIFSVNDDMPHVH